MRPRHLVILLLLACCSSSPLPPATPSYLVVPDAYALMGSVDRQDPGYLLAWLAKAGPRPWLVIDSPGGDLEPSLAIAAAVARRGDVRCLVRGMAASGAFAVLQSCAHRAMTAASTLMTHEPSWSLDGSFDRYEMRRDLADLEQAADRWNQLCARRLLVTTAEYLERVRGRSWQMTAEEALRVGAVDEVVP